MEFFNTLIVYPLYSGFFSKKFLRIRSANKTLPIRPHQGNPDLIFLLQAAFGRSFLHLAGIFLVVPDFLLCERNFFGYVVFFEKLLEILAMRTFLSVVVHNQGVWIAGIIGRSSIRRRRHHPPRDKNDEKNSRRRSKKKKISPRHTQKIQSSFRGGSIPSFSRPSHQPAPSAKSTIKTERI